MGISLLSCQNIPPRRTQSGENLFTDYAAHLPKCHLLLNENMLRYT